MQPTNQSLHGQRSSHLSRIDRDGNSNIDRSVHNLRFNQGIGIQKEEPSKSSILQTRLDKPLRPKSRAEAKQNLSSSQVFETNVTVASHFPENEIISPSYVVFSNDKQIEEAIPGLLDHSSLNESLKKTAVGRDFDNSTIRRISSPTNMISSSLSYEDLSISRLGREDDMKGRDLFDSSRSSSVMNSAINIFGDEINRQTELSTLADSAINSVLNAISNIRQKSNVSSDSTVRSTSKIGTPQTINMQLSNKENYSGFREGDDKKSLNFLSKSSASTVDYVSNEKKGLLTSGISNASMRRTLFSDNSSSTKGTDSALNQLSLLASQYTKGDSTSPTQSVPSSTSGLTIAEILSSNNQEAKYNNVLSNLLTHLSPEKKPHHTQGTSLKEVLSDKGGDLIFTTTAPSMSQLTFVNSRRNSIDSTSAASTVSTTPFIPSVPAESSHPHRLHALQSQLDLYKRKLGVSEDRINKDTLEIRELEDSVLQLSSQLQTAGGREAELRHSLELAEASLSTVEAEKKDIEEFVKRLESEIFSVNSSLSQLTQERTSAQNEATALKSLVDSGRIRITELEELLMKESSENESKDSFITHLSSELSETKEALRIAREDVSRGQNLAETLGNRVKVLEKEVDMLKSELNDEQENLKFLRETSANAVEEAEMALENAVRNANQQVDELKLRFEEERVEWNLKFEKEKEELRNSFKLYESELLFKHSQELERAAMSESTTLKSLREAEAELVSLKSRFKSTEEQKEKLELSVASQSIEISGLKSNLEIAQSALETLRSTSASLSAEFHKKDEQIHSLNLETQSLHAETLKASQRLLEAERERAAAVFDFQLSKATAASAVNDSENKSKEIERLKLTIEEQRLQFDQYTLEMKSKLAASENTVGSRVEAFESEITSLKQQLESVRIDNTTVLAKSHEFEDLYKQEQQTTAQLRARLDLQETELLSLREMLTVKEKELEGLKSSKITLEAELQSERLVLQGLLSEQAATAAHNATSEEMVKKHNDEMKNLKGHYKHAKSKSEALQKELNQMKDELESCKQALSAAELDSSRNTLELTQARSDLVKLQDDHVHVKESSEKLSRELLESKSDLEAQKAVLEERMHALSAREVEVAQLQASLEESRAESLKLRAELERLEFGYHRAEGELTAGNEEMLGAVEALAKVRSELRVLSQSFQSVEAELEVVKVRNCTLEAELAEMTDLQNQRASESAAKEEELRALRLRLGELERLLGSTVNENALRETVTKESATRIAELEATVKDDRETMDELMSALDAAKVRRNEFERKWRDALDAARELKQEKLSLIQRVEELSTLTSSSAAATPEGFVSVAEMENLRMQLQREYDENVKVLKESLEAANFQVQSLSSESELLTSKVSSLEALLLAAEEAGSTLKSSFEQSKQKCLEIEESLLLESQKRVALQSERDLLSMRLNEAESTQIELLEAQKALRLQLSEAKQEYERLESNAEFEASRNEALAQQGRQAHLRERDMLQARVDELRLQNDALREEIRKWETEATEARNRAAEALRRAKEGQELTLKDMQQWAITPFSPSPSKSAPVSELVANGENMTADILSDKQTKGSVAFLPAVPVISTSEEHSEAEMDQSVSPSHENVVGMEYDVAIVEEDSHSKSMSSSPVKGVFTGSSTPTHDSYSPSPARSVDLQYEGGQSRYLKSSLSKARREIARLQAVIVDLRQESSSNHISLHSPPNPIPPTGAIAASIQEPLPIIGSLVRNNSINEQNGSLEEVASTSRRLNFAEVPINHVTVSLDELANEPLEFSPQKPDRASITSEEACATADRKDNSQLGSLKSIPSLSSLAEFSSPSLLHSVLFPTMSPAVGRGADNFDVSPTKRSLPSLGSFIRSPHNNSSISMLLMSPPAKMDQSTALKSTRKKPAPFLSPTTEAIYDAEIFETISKMVPEEESISLIREMIKSSKQ